MGTYCLKCIYCLLFNNRKNFDFKKLTVTNKVVRAKSKCATCMANKSRFSKQKHNKKVIGNINPNHYKTC